MRTREVALSAAMALWGVAIAIALVAVWSGPAVPGQLPSYATAINLDSRAPLRFVLGLIVLPLLLPVVMRPVVRRLAAVDTQRWAVNGVVWSSVVTIWFAVIERDVAWTVVPYAIVIAGCLALRRHAATFTRRDVILIPSTLAAFLGLIDAFGDLSIQNAVVLALMLVAAVRIAITFIPSPVVPALSFLIAPLAFALQTNFFSRDQRYFGWHVLVVVLASPFLVRVFLRNERRALIALAFVIYPICCYSYTNATSIPTAEGRPRISFFEDAHHLVPVSELLRGEKLYRDIVPTHGFVEDAALTWISVRLRGTTAGAALRGRFIFAALTSVAAYAMAAAMTGSMEAGVLAFFLGSMLGAITPTVRVVPAMFTLAVLAWAVRRRDTKAFIAAGAGTVIALMTSLDFGSFTLLATLAALVRFRFERKKAWWNAMLGALIAGVPFAIGLAIHGVLFDFFRVTLRELPTGSTTGTMNVFSPPPIIGMFGHVPEILGALLMKPGNMFIIWVFAAVFAGVFIARPASRRIEPVFIVAFWIVVAAVSYAMRHHVFFEFATAPFLIGIAWLIIRRWPFVTPLVVILLVMIARPTIHIAIVNGLRHARGPMDAGLTEITDVRRARGALFTTADADVVHSVQRYVQARLSPSDTFFDFTDRPVLYFLLQRDCPIRQVVVPFYETEALQRQVIERIDRNPHVVAALVPGGVAGPQFDGVPNEVRAPLVWQYLQQHFEPEFQEGSVVFWRRRQ